MTAELELEMSTMMILAVAALVVATLSDRLVVAVAQGQSISSVN